VTCFVYHARSPGPSVPCRSDATPISPKWLGWEDSNLRMTGSKPVALPLGYTPAVNLHRRATRQRDAPARGSRPARGPRTPSSGPAARQRRARLPSRSRRPRTRSRRCPSASRDSPRRIAPNPVERRRDGRVSPPDHGLAVVAPPGRKKAANCRFRGIACQFGAEKISAVDTAQSGQTTRYQAGGRRPARSRSPTPSAQAERPCTNTGTSAPSSGPAPRAARRPVQPPQAFSATSTVAASELPPPRPPPAGMRLRTRISAPPPAARRRLQAARRAHREVRVRRHTPPALRAPDAAVGRGLDEELVAVIEQLEDGLQGVIAVGPPASDVQEQVQLGGRRPGRLIGARASARPESPSDRS
jgi:hypothetical protein